MFSLLFRLSLVCMIGYGGFRVFKEQMTARFCRTEAKKLESRFEELLVLDSDRFHLRKMKIDSSFGSWLYFAPAGKAFELQLQTKEAASTIMRVPSRSSGHYGLIQIQFVVDDAATLPVCRTLEIFGPDFKHYTQTPEKDALFGEIDLLHEAIGSKVNPIEVRAAIAPLSNLQWDQPIRNQATHVFCDANQKAVLAYFSEMELPGASKITHAHYAVTVVAKEK